VQKMGQQIHAVHLTVDISPHFLSFTSWTYFNALISCDMLSEFSLQSQSAQFLVTD
jgi:nitrate/nitrite transporter NarK